MDRNCYPGKTPDGSFAKRNNVGLFTKHTQVKHEHAQDENNKSNKK